jgi:hypothetical protein
MFIGAAAWAQLPPVPEEAPAQPEAQPRAHVAKRLQDIGTVLEGDKANVSWLLQNQGRADLVITGTRTSCGCAVVQLKDDQKIVPPGDVLELVVQFDSRGRRGVQNKTVTVLTNDPAEPELTLRFKAAVQNLYEIQPPTAIVNLRAVRRGEAVRRTIDIYPGPGRKAVKITGFAHAESSPLSFQSEPFDAGNGTGQRVRMTVGEDVALGGLSAEATLKLDIDGITRTRKVLLRGEVVGDLTWHPRVIDATRQPSLPGKRLAPVTIRSTDTIPFKVLEATGGSYFDVTFERTREGTRGTQYSVFLDLREDVPQGPFGTTLEVRTDSLDQPLVRVPVFGIVPAPVEVDPPVILLRQDGTLVGTRRRVKLQAHPEHALALSDIHCDHEAVKAAVDWEASRAYGHLRFLEVTLGPGLAPGRYSATLTVKTNVPGASQLAIPVNIDVPAHTEP